ncbi:DNA-binding transcriptional MerR regulator [Anoxybacillus calidus]|jgi:MerR family transcriptional regulator, light-induced transcriptional regulator|uniref:DNA-binding transcriptional MerR regulator n=1 Tax=[Anoxybacillus] calidus TaxID=575178 RepID=A0A7V9YXM1_9BACL|nr:MerR family transcriptional regulator [Anoxybacillus calidus]MBA2870140.1 DNA-binding transcriptional MerR regulator [Anoxybacillus calidus]
MSSQEGKYNIKAVSKMLGIQPGTLRAWERRYQIIAPKRNESGHRLYTEEHVKILKWLISKINKGFTISQAVSLLEKNGMEATSSFTDEERSDFDVHLMDELLEALLSFDENRANELMNRAFSMYTVEKVVVDILGSLLACIGDLWEKKKITSAHEHFASSFIRSKIGIIFSTIPINGVLPKTISVCGPDEWHELGLLMFTLYLRQKGFETIYLGTSIAENDIDVVIDEVKPKFLFLSCTLKQNIEKTFALIDRLSEKYPGLTIGVGGKAFERLEKKEKEIYGVYVVGQTKKEWEKWLENQL